MSLPKKHRGASTRALKILDGEGVPYRTLAFEAVEKTAEEASEKTGVPLGRTIKTLLVRAKHKGYLLVLCPGDRLVDMKKVASAIGDKHAEMAERSEVHRITGYLIGGVSPLGAKRDIPVIVEKSIMDEPEIMVNAGGWGRMILIEPETLKGVLGPRAIVADVARIPQKY